jgi:AcrR family transcriptional regulator
VSRSQPPEALQAGSPVPSVEESARKAELAQRLLEYSAAHGLSGMSLRPLAAAIGSSPRMLLYFFGSKEGLIREVLAMSRARQMSMVDQWLGEEGLAEAGSLDRLWQWLTDPAQADVERLFFESYGRSLTDQGDGPWHGFGADSVTDWLPLITRMLRPVGGRAQDRADATFVLAVLRGLLLDLLATDDAERVAAAFQLLRRAFDVMTASGSVNDSGAHPHERC